MKEERVTQQLQDAQVKREAAEREHAKAAPDPQETAEHERRADKARYLREKLDERAESERRKKR
jgi:hypothetical protein